jgi:divalent metal cation (Fe/Co/Zn/Cd) transporter
MRQNKIFCDLCGKEINVLIDDAVSFVEITKIHAKMIINPSSQESDSNEESTVSQNIRTEREAKTMKADICKDCTIELENYMHIQKVKNLEKKVEDNITKEKNDNKRNKRSVS